MGRGGGKGDTGKGGMKERGEDRGNGRGGRGHGMGRGGKRKGKKEGEGKARRGATAPPPNFNTWRCQ